MHDPIGKLIAGRFRVLEVLGSGGIGAVYRAVQEPLDREVALKMLRPELSESQEIRRRFAREARAVAALSHPNIAMVHDFGVGRDGALFMAMELVRGPSLADLLGADNLTWEEIVGLFDQILTGLAHAHARGVISRDIKPANVLVARQEDGSSIVKIVDFGIAALAGFAWSDDERHTGVGQVVGTPQYMAPEQARGERHVSATVDIYATGLMLYRAVTGHEAFDGDNPMDILMAQVHNPPPPIVLRPGLEAPAAVRELILDALKKSPRDRIPSANAFRARLRVLGGRQTAAHGTVRVTASRPVVTAGTLVEEAATVEARLVDAQMIAVDGPPERGELPALALFRGELPFVGREDDLARVVDASIAALQAGRGAIVVVDAEAGAGKSRVIAAAREHLVEHAGCVAAHGAFHREGERGFRGVREAFDNLLGLRRDAVSSTSLDAQLAAWGVDDIAERRALAAMLRPSFDSAETQANPQPDALTDVLLRILEVASARSPLVLTIDDLQWSGRETEMFLDRVASELAYRPMPVVILCGAQTGDGQSGASERIVQRLSRFDGQTVVRHSLRPLPDPDAHRLVAALMPATTELSLSIVARAGGNPMHIVQLLRYLAEERLLEATPLGWRAARGVDVSGLLPPTLADIMQLRIDQLDALAPGGRVKDLLNRCAVLGRSFRFSVLERMLQVENRADLLENIDRDIDLLLDEEYLLMTRSSQDDVLTFPNSLIRDALNARMRNRRTTRRLHAYAAEAKLAVLGRDVEKLAEELVRHFSEAGDGPRELQYALVAADVAERGYRPHDAVALLTRALALLQDEGAPGADGQVDIHLRIGRLLMGLGEYAEAERHFIDVDVESNAGTRERLVAQLGRADTARALGDSESARPLLQAALVCAQERGDNELVVDALAGLASLHWQIGDMDAAQRAADEALQVAATAAPRKRPEVQWLLGDLARSRGELAAAVVHFDEALKTFRAAGDRRGVAKCTARLAVTHRARNDLDAAEANYEAARELYASVGDRRGVAHQLNGLGDVARFRGERDRAGALYRRAVDAFQELQLPYDAAIALTNLGLVAVETGRDNDAEDAFRRALVVAERIGHAYLTIGVGLNLAYVLVKQEREDEANEVLDAALELADKSELVDPDFARPLERIADVFASAGDEAEAHAMLLRARGMWAELGRAADTERVDAQLARTASR